MKVHVTDITLTGGCKWQDDDIFPCITICHGRLGFNPFHRMLLVFGQVRPPMLLQPQVVCIRS